METERQYGGSLQRLVGRLVDAGFLCTEFGCGASVRGELRHFKATTPSAERWGVTEGESWIAFTQEMVKAIDLYHSESIPVAAKIVLYTPNVCVSEEKTQAHHPKEAK